MRARPAARIAVASFSALLASLPALAGAEPKAAPAAERERLSWEADAEAYCRYVTAGADAESALALSPQVFGEAGIVHSTVAPSGSGSLPETRRVAVGASYSLGEAYRGFMLRTRAKAECDRYRTASQLLAFVAANEDGVSPEALSAELRVLEEAMPRAQEILSQTRARVEQSLATIDDLALVERRVAELGEKLRAARLSLDVARGAPRSPAVPAPELLRAHAEEEARVEHYNASLRASHGWDVGVRGGYERVLGAHEQVPVFGMVTASISLGLLAQPFTGSRAVEGRRGWATAEIKGTHDRAATVLRRLRAIERAERARLDEVSAEVSDLEARLKAIASIGGEKAKRFAEHVWFDLVLAKAEREYLSAHLRDLAAVLGGEAKAT